MKTCFLHIGSEKTGTTSVQRFFGNYRDELLRDGYWYPRSATNNTTLHRKLSTAALQGALDDDNEMVQEFKAECGEAERAGAHTAVISSEFFHSTFRHPEPIAYLHNFLKELFDDIYVVYYARRQDHLAVSMHSTALRVGQSDARSALAIYDLKGHHYFDHLAVCDLWSNEFGRDKMICRIFDRKLLFKGDVIDDFRQIVGVTGDYGKNPTANQSFSADCMNVLRLFNSSPYAGNHGLRKIFIKIGKERGGTKVPMLTKAEAQEFLSRFQARNLEFFAKYVDPSLGTDFEGGFDSFPDALPEPTPDDIVNFLFAPGPEAADMDDGDDDDAELLDGYGDDEDQAKRQKSGRIRGLKKRQEKAARKREQAAAQAAPEGRKRRRNKKERKGRKRGGASAEAAAE